MSDSIFDSPRGSRDWPEIRLADGVTPLNRIYSDSITLSADLVRKFPKVETDIRDVLTCAPVSSPTVGTITLKDGRLIKLDGHATVAYQPATTKELVVKVAGKNADQTASEIARAIVESFADLLAESSGAALGIFDSKGRSFVESNSLGWVTSTHELTLMRPGFPPECLVGSYHPNCNYLRLVACSMSSSTDTHSTFSRQWQVDMARLGENNPSLDIVALLKVGSLRSVSRDQNVAPPREFVTWMETETVTAAALRDSSPDSDSASSQSIISPQNIAASQKQTTRPTWGSLIPLTSERYDPEIGEIRDVTRRAVAAGTRGKPISKSGEIVTVDKVNDLWAIETTEQAMGIAGNALDGVSQRVRAYRDNWSWPRVLSYVSVWGINTDPADVYSPTTKYGWRPVWLQPAYNGPCDFTMIERWTKKQPIVSGDDDWNTGETWTQFQVNSLVARIWELDDYITHNGDTYKCLISHSADVFATDLAAGKWRESSPKLPAETQMFPQEIEFTGNELNVQVAACLHSGLWLKDSSSYASWLPTIPTRWPASILARVILQPDQGGWLTQIIRVDSPDSDGRSSGVDLRQTSGGSTSFELEWTPGGGVTKLDVSLSPEFDGAYLTGYKNLTVASSAPYKINVIDVSRGVIYYARVKRDNKSSNICVCMAKPSPEVAVLNDANGAPVKSEATVLITTTEVGQRKSFTYTVSNPGMKKLEDVLIKIEGDQTVEYELTKPDFNALPPGQKAKLEIIFAPTSKGTKRTTLNIASNAVESPFKLKLVGIGSAAEIALEQPEEVNLNTGGTLSFGTVTMLAVNKVFKLRNTGNAPLRAISAAIVGPDEDDYQITPTMSSDDIPPESFRNFTVCFSPRDSEEAFTVRTAQLRIISSDADENPFLVNLTGAYLNPYAAGAVDYPFALSVNSTVRAMAWQSDGKLVFGGEFTSVAGSARTRLARLNADSTLDTFAPSLDNAVLAIAVQVDGKILVGGAFTGGLKRLNTDGTNDTGFTATVVGEVRCLCVLPDGKILVGGNLTGWLLKLNADGTAASGFSHTVNGPVNGIILDSAGKIVLVGEWVATPPIHAPPPPPHPHIPPLHPIIPPSHPPPHPHPHLPPPHPHVPPPHPLPHPHLPPPHPHIPPPHPHPHPPPPHLPPPHPHIPPPHPHPHLPPPHPHPHLPPPHPHIPPPHPHP